MKTPHPALLALLAARVSLADVQWSTTTCWSTLWSTKAAETMWSTEWSTQWVTKPAVTVTDYLTVTSTYEKDFTTTIYDTITSSYEKDFTTTVYDTVVSTSIETDTVYKSFESLVTATATITKVSVSTVTVTSLGTTIVPGKASTATVVIQNTVTQACTTIPPIPTSGIVLCPTRTLNEQGYTPPTPLPSDYLWGCPPHSLCKPIQINCNFERDVYAETYICAPENCIPAELPPPSGAFGPFASDDNSTCPFFEPFDSYPVINPSLFGLDYSEFAVPSLGIYPTDCEPTTPVVIVTTPYTTPPPPPPATTTVVPTTQPYTTPSSEWLPWTTSSPTYVPPPASSTPVVWSPWVPPASKESSSTWAEWDHSSAAGAHSWGSEGEPSATGWGWSSTITHAPRAIEARAAASVTIPKDCQPVCDSCIVVGAYYGLNYNSLCTSGAPYSAKHSSCTSCAHVHGHDGAVELVLTQLTIWQDVCSHPPTQSTTTTASPQALSSSTTTTPQSPVKPSTTTAVATSTPPTPSTPTTTSTVPLSTTTPSSSAVTTTASSSAATTTISNSVTTTTTAATTSGTGGAQTSGVTTECAVSQITDGQPQATDCTIAPTSPSVSVASFTSGAGAMPTHRPVVIAAVVGVVVVVAMA